MQISNHLSISLLVVVVVVTWCASYTTASGDNPTFQEALQKFQNQDQTSIVSQPTNQGVRGTPQFSNDSKPKKRPDRDPPPIPVGKVTDPTTQPSSNLPPPRPQNGLPSQKSQPTGISPPLASITFDNPTVGTSTSSTSSNESNLSCRQFIVGPNRTKKGQNLGPNQNQQSPVKSPFRRDDCFEEDQSESTEGLKPEKMDFERATVYFGFDLDQKKSDILKQMEANQTPTFKTEDSSVFHWLDVIPRVDPKNPKSHVKVTQDYVAMPCNVDSPEKVCGVYEETGLMCIGKSFFSSESYCVKPLGDQGDACKRKNTVKKCAYPYHCLPIKREFINRVKKIFDFKSFGYACQMVMTRKLMKEMKELKKFNK